MGLSASESPSSGDDGSPGSGRSYGPCNRARRFRSTEVRDDACRQRRRRRGPAGSGERQRGARHRRGGPVHGGARRERRERCAAEHPARRRLLRAEPLVGAQRLHADLRRVPAAWRAGRPSAPPAPPLSLRGAAVRLGRRRLFMAGIALFSGASLVCGVSQSEATLLIARGAQGLGGALVSPAALSIILTTFAEGSERNRALAVWGAIAGAGGAVGLLLGGAIVELLSWRWVFFINVPIAAAVLLLAPRILAESRAEGVRRGYDLEGATAITLGTMILVSTLIKANDWGWGSARTVAGVAVAGVLLVGFVWIERRHENP